MKTEPTNHGAGGGALEIVDLARISYADAYRTQVAWRDHLIDARAGVAVEAAELPKMRVFLLEHDPAVITMTRRKGIEDHLRATPDVLRAAGIEVVQTDRGGDITYHGPGQLVAYAVLDLKRLGLGVHEYMHALEQIVINTLAEYGIVGKRDPNAVGVWVVDPADRTEGARMVKICALGVRIRKWVTLHGLALNVQPDLSHFETIVPCGLTGRGVTSMQEILRVRGGRRTRGEEGPSVGEVKQVMAAKFAGFVESRILEDG